MSGPGGLTASLSLDWIGVESSLSPHFLANLSDIEFFPPTVDSVRKLYFYASNMLRLSAYYVGVYVQGLFALFVKFFHANSLG